MSDPCNPTYWSLPGSSVHGISSGKNTGIGCHFLLQWTLQTQGLNLRLLHCRLILYCWATELPQESATSHLYTKEVKVGPWTDIGTLIFTPALITIAKRRLLFSHSVVSDSLQPHGLQHARLPVQHHLLELTQTHVHRVGDAIQPSHPLLSPSPPALNLSQHQGLFQWVGSSHLVVKVLELQLHHQSFQWIFRIDFL